MTRLAVGLLCLVATVGGCQIAPIPAMVPVVIQNKTGIAATVTVERDGVIEDYAADPVTAYSQIFVDCPQRFRIVRLIVGAGDSAVTTSFSDEQNVVLNRDVNYAC